MKNGHEQVLTYQYGGGSSSGLPVDGQWRCMPVGGVANLRNKISRGGFTGAFLIQCLTAMGVTALRLED